MGGVPFYSSSFKTTFKKKIKKHTSTFPDCKLFKENKAKMVAFTASLQFEKTKSKNLNIHQLNLFINIKIRMTPIFTNQKVEKETFLFYIKL